MKAETKAALGRLTAKIREYKYALLVLLLGVVLLLLPTAGGSDETTDEEVVPKARAAPDGGIEDTERRLEEILSLIDGAGEVRVMLTLNSDGERVLARETERSSDTGSDGASEKSSDSALIVQRGSGQSGEVEVKYLYPDYRGAIVAAQGAGSAQIRAQLLEAVSSATGLGAGSITIVKMR